MVSVDEQLCTGCGKCAKVCPEGIEIAGGKAFIKNSGASCIDDAVSACPSGALFNDGDKKNNRGKELLDRLRHFLNDVRKEAGSEIKRGRGKGRGMGRGRRAGRGRGGRRRQG